jgi:aminoglycoside phosphotransferase (APT) family kinase protein
MIPEEKKNGVARALQESFGVTDFTAITRMTKGLSSDLVFRIVVRDTPYLLRIMTRIDERMDPNRIITCMNAASAAGLTPCVRYANAEAGISITNFVEAVPFPAGQALVQLPSTLRRLHALQPFPKAFNYVTAHNFFIWRFRKANLLPKDDVEEVFTRYEQVCAAYPRLDSDMVSCHMDLKPENILFDGQQVWLVDWQAAFVNDRYFDLSIVANFVVTNEADELTYLDRYFGQPPTEYQRARFFLMRQFIHIFYATVFLLLGSAGKPIDLSVKLPSFRDFHQRIWAGEINLADNDLKIAYGRVHWEQLLHNMRQTRFEEALRIVSDQNSYPDVPHRLLPLPQMNAES